jgi:hypothetical protein
MFNITELSLVPQPLVIPAFSTQSSPSALVSVAACADFLDLSRARREYIGVTVTYSAVGSSS